MKFKIVSYKIISYNRNSNIKSNGRRSRIIWRIKRRRWKRVVTTWWRSILRQSGLRVILRRLTTIYGGTKYAIGRKRTGWTANDWAVNDASIIDVGRRTWRWLGS